MTGSSNSGALISVVIPVRNGERTISACLNSLSSQSLSPDEIIVVDNGSTDGTVSLVKEWSLTHGMFQMQLTFEGKPGPSAARNRGARIARGRHLAFLDADCVASPDWLQTISKQLRSGNSGAVGGPYQGHVSLPAIERYAAVSWFFGVPEESVSCRHPFVSRFLLGGNTALLKKHFESAGGFNETLTVGEDLDLSFRLKKEGVSIRLLQDLAVLHQTRSSVSKRLSRAFCHGMVQARIAKNHFPRRIVFSVFEKGFECPFPCTIALEGVSLTKCLTLLFLLGSGHAAWTLFFLFVLILGWEGRLLYRTIWYGASLTFREAVEIPLHWGLSRLSMEIGRLAGSVRHKVVCW